MYALAQTNAPSPLARAKSVMPSCYSRELHACLNRDNQNGLPQADCDAIMAAYDVDWDAAEAYVDALPYCSHKSTDVMTLVMVGAGGVVVGFVLSSLFRKRR